MIIVRTMPVDMLVKFDYDQYFELVLFVCLCIKFEMIDFGLF